jgi:hypothetical protein
MPVTIEIVKALKMRPPADREIDNSPASGTGVRPIPNACLRVSLTTTTAGKQRVIDDSRATTNI